MKSVVLTKINAPWEIVDKETPQPKEGQVLLKIHACGLCGTDLHVSSGLFPVPLPCTMGHEPVGEVVAKGPGVLNLKVGDRVGVSWVQRGCGRCSLCQSGLEKYCSDCKESTWIGMGGGLSEYMVAWESGCTLIPEGLSYEQAAPMFCAGFTIASGFHNGKPKPGDRIGVFGIGGLGHLAIQYAKAKGHPVVAITESPNKRELAKKLGADEVIVVSDKLVSDVQALGGIDVLLHTGNASKVISELLDAMNPEGRIVIMGIDRTPFQASPMKLLNKQLKIIGSKQNKAKHLVDILRLAAKGQITPMIELFPLSTINEAVQKLAQGSLRFRAVITMK